MEALPPTQLCRITASSPKPTKASFQFAQVQRATPSNTGNFWQRGDWFGPWRDQAMVECQLPKLEVGGSIPVARSSFFQEFLIAILEFNRNVINVPQTSRRILHSQVSASRDETPNGF
jgi:hypothetical protein